MARCVALARELTSLEGPHELAKCAPNAILKHMIPNILYPFFWDIDIQSFDPQAHPEYTIGRILELGNPAAVHWLKAEFSEEQIKAVIKDDHRLSAKSATFWALVYRISVHDVSALRS